MLLKLCCLRLRRLRQGQASAFVTTRIETALSQENRGRDLLASTDGLASADTLFFGRTRNDAKNFFLFHNEEIVSIEFDLGTGVLAEQNAVAFLHRKWEQLAFIVGLALAHRDDSALLWFIFGRIGDDEASSRSSRFFYAAHQDAVMERCKFRCHRC